LTELRLTTYSFQYTTRSFAACSVDRIYLLETDGSQWKTATRTLAESRYNESVPYSGDTSVCPAAGRGKLRRWKRKSLPIKYLCFF